MTDSEGQEFIPMHFIWIERGIQDAINLRKKLKGANKKEKKRIARNLALDNLFMLKRNNNACFSNLIYQKILEDEDKLDKIIREISKILIDSFMKEKSLKKAIKNEYLRAEIFDSNTTLTEFIQKSNKTNEDALKYLRRRWEYYMDRGDIEGAIGAESYFREYQTGTIQYEILFSKSQLYEGVIFPQRYTYDTKAFCISKIHNYRLYQTLTMGFPHFLGELKTFFAKPIQTKLLNVMKSLFEIEEDSEIEHEYNVFINRLLSIASLIYFQSLTIIEKIKLLNQKLSLKELINSILEKDIKNFKSWARLVDSLSEYSFPDLAQKFIEPFQPYIENLEISDKMVTYEIIAKIYKNQGNYEESQKFIQLALKCFDNDIEKKLNKNPLFEILILSDLAEVTGKSSNVENLGKIMSKIQELKTILTDPREIHDAYLRISQVFRFLGKFEEERSVLNELIDLNYSETLIEEQSYIKLRINTYYSSKMDIRKLSNNDRQEYLVKRMAEAFECIKHLYLKEAEIKFQEIMRFTGINPELEDKMEIYKHLGITCLYNQEYQKSSDMLKQSSDNSLDFESLLYCSISYWMIEEKEKAKELLRNLPSIFNNAKDETLAIFDYWLLTLTNILGVNNLELFFQFIFNTDPNIFDLWINVSMKLADFGFLNSAQKFIVLSIGHSESNQQKALCYNVLGTILANKDAHQEAINQYREALKLDPNYILCYQNLGRSFMHKQDYKNAIRNFKKALQIVSKRGYPLIEIMTIKSDLSYCESYEGNYFNIDRITSEKVKNALISAERIFLHFYDKKDLLDASSIINSYSKALEIILHEKISPIFNPLIETYREPYFKRELTGNFHMKFGNLFREKSLNPGTWGRILQDFQKTQNEPFLEEFRNCLIDHISDDVLDAMKSTCDFITPIRNPLTHQENITLDEVVKRRREIIKLLNDLIDKLYIA